MLRRGSKTWLLAFGLGSVLALFAAGSAQAEEETPGKFMVRLRNVAVLPTVSATTTIGGDVNASSTDIPEADITYFFTPNLAVEAIGATTRHHITWLNPSGANIDLGKVNLLPPTVTAQYHFLTENRFSPYIGAGLNYTVFFNAKAAGGTVTKVSYENSFGLALQAGADFRITGPWYLNVDVKHIFLDTSVKLNGGAIKGDVHLDPTLVGIGVGYRF